MTESNVNKKKVLMAAAGAALILGSGAFIAGCSMMDKKAAPIGGSANTTGKTPMPLGSTGSRNMDTPQEQKMKGSQMSEVTAEKAKYGNKDLGLDNDPPVQESSALKPEVPPAASNNTDDRPETASGKTDENTETALPADSTNLFQPTSTKTSNQEPLPNPQKPAQMPPPKPLRLNIPRTTPSTSPTTVPAENETDLASESPVAPSTPAFDLIQKIKDAKAQSFRLSSSRLAFAFSGKVTFKKLENEAGEPFVIFAMNPTKYDSLFGSTPTHKFDMAELDSAEKFEFFEKIGNMNYRYTVTFLGKPGSNVDWIKEFVKEDKQQAQGDNLRTHLYKFLIFHAKTLIEKTANLNQDQTITKAITDYLKDGARLAVTREPVPDDQMVVKTIATSIEISPDSSLETMIHKVDNIFHQVSAKGYYYHVGGMDLKLPQSDAFESPDKWTAPEEHYHVYQKSLDHGFEIYIKSPHELDDAKVSLIGGAIAESIGRVERRELNASLMNSWKEFLTQQIDNNTPLSWFKPNEETREIRILVVKKPES